MENVVIQAMIRLPAHALSTHVPHDSRRSATLITEPSLDDHCARHDAYQSNVNGKMLVRDGDDVNALRRQRLAVLAYDPRIQEMELRDVLRLSLGVPENVSTRIVSSGAATCRSLFSDGVIPTHQRAMGKAAKRLQGHADTWEITLGVSATDFLLSEEFMGPRKGFIFRSGDYGTGYYVDDVEMAMVTANSYACHVSAARFVTLSLSCCHCSVAHDWVRLAPGRVGLGAGYASSL